jgi:Uma2 family endonuclease
MITSLYLTPKDQGRPLTLDEFQRADSLEGHRYELIHGKLEVTPLPNLFHDEVLDWLKDRLKDYAKSRPDILRKIKGPARVFVEDDPDVTAPEPDVAAYRVFPDDLNQARADWQDITPVLVAEVLSPDSAEKDLIRNLELYLQVPSIREYWVIDPLTDSWQPSMTVYRRRGRHWQRPIHVEAGGTYTTRLLPGFTLDLDLRK